MCIRDSKIADKGFVTTYRKGKAAYIHPEVSLTSYQNDLLKQQTDFWFDGQPSKLLEAWCANNTLTVAEAEKIKELLLQAK